VKWVSENSCWMRICLWRDNKPLSDQSRKGERRCIGNGGELQQKTIVSQVGNNIVRWGARRANAHVAMRGGISPANY
jgi:hypothetical protein